MPFDGPALNARLVASCNLGVLGHPIALGHPGVLGILGERLFIFRDLRSTGNYFRGAGEKASSFGDLGSPAKIKNKGKASILFDFLNFLLLLGDTPQTPLSIINVLFFT